MTAHVEFGEDDDQRRALPMLSRCQKWRFARTRLDLRTLQRSSDQGDISVCAHSKLCRAFYHVPGSRLKIDSELCVSHARAVGLERGDPCGLPVGYRDGVSDSLIIQAADTVRLKAIR